MPTPPTTHALALAALGGGLYWAAQPPLGISVFGFVALAPLVLAVRGSTPTRAFLLGWMAGTIAFCGLTSPSVYEALVRARHPAWLALLEAIAVPQLTGALHMAAFAVYVAVLERRWSERPSRLFVIAAAWVVAELGRARIGHGMPWVLLAHSQAANLPVLQIADLAGASGISFVLALVGAGVATAWVDRRAPGPRRRAVVVASAALVVAIAWTYGVRQTARWEAPAGPDLRLALVQGNIPHEWRYALSRLPDTLARYRALVTEAMETRPDLVILPENAISVSVAANPQAFAEVAGALGATETLLLVGAPREIAVGPGRAATRNSAYMLDRGGAVLGVYDKRHLVPFGETSTWLLPGRLPQWLGITETYTPGDALTLLPVRGAHLATLICWEGIYADAAREAVRAGADVLVNLSNDDWFGPRAAKEQHFRATMLRAVETRRFLVRVTNSGVTGVVDPRGAVVATAPRDAAAVVPARITALAGRTLYTRIGDAFAWVCVLVVALALVWRPSASTRGPPRPTAATSVQSCDAPSSPAPGPS
ncbi:MAG: apolipoprotein N-acyltransferase [Candidatus Binatia bacterium]